MGIEIGTICMAHALVTLAVLLYCKKRLRAIRRVALDAMDHSTAWVHGQAREPGDAIGAASPVSKADSHGATAPERAGDEMGMAPGPDTVSADVEAAQYRAAIIASARQSRDLVFVAILFLVMLTVAMTLETVVTLDWAAPVAVGSAGEPAALMPGDLAPSPVLPANTRPARQTEPVTLADPGRAGKQIAPSGPPGNRRLANTATMGSNASPVEHEGKEEPAGTIKGPVTPNRLGINTNWWHDVRVSLRLVQAENGDAGATGGFPAEVTLIYAAVYRRVARYAIIGLCLIGAGGTVLWLLVWQLAAAEGRDPLTL